MHLPKLSQRKAMARMFLSRRGAETQFKKSRCDFWVKKRVSMSDFCMFFYIPPAPLTSSNPSGFEGGVDRNLLRTSDFRLRSSVFRLRFSSPMHLLHKIHHKLYIFNGNARHQPMPQVEDPFGFLFVEGDKAVQLFFDGFLVGEKDAGVEVAL